jgi:DNA replication and repair protein RecF
MQLLSLHYERFRNLADVSLTPSPRTTIAVGENGQGKTNLLEGLYFLATLKPLRAGRLAELVQFGAASARVTGRFLLAGAEREISVEVMPGARTAFVDGKRAASLEAYFGGVSVVAFTPDDLGVVKGGPDGRRAFLDRTVFNRFPAYLDESREYARALKSRNRLLKDGAPVSHLQAWDATLAKVGARLWTRRREVLGELSGRAAQTFTSVGPHADDLELSLGEHAARQFASQGQARALVLAWKVAEIENLQATNGFLPLLLLDDVSSELDPERNAFLMGYLAESGAQTLLTTTDAHLVARAVGAETAWYRVKNGQVTREPPQGASATRAP